MDHPSEKQLLDTMQGMIDKTLDDVFDTVNKRLEDLDTAAGATEKPAPSPPPAPKRRPAKPPQKVSGEGLQQEIADVTSLIDQQLNKGGGSR